MTRKWRFVLLVSLIGNLTIVYVGYKAYEFRSHINEWLVKYLYVVDEFSCREHYEAANTTLQCVVANCAGLGRNAPRISRLGDTT